MIEIKNVTKIYDKQDNPALKGVSFSLPEKGMIFILGKSGSGKSTLLNLLGGLDTITSGEVTLSGTWAVDRYITVTADKEIDMVNSINSNDKKVLAVTFDGIGKRGSNTEAQTVTKSISVENIKFSYTGNEKDSLDGVSFEIKPYEKIALVGFNGAGKTTLTNLLLRLYDVKDGSIKIGGRDIREETVESHRNRFAAVS